MTMPDVPLIEMSYTELLTLKGEIDKILLQKADERRNELLAELAEVNKIRTSAKATKYRHKAKYRSPEGHRWSGQGVTPKWLREHEAKGGSRDDFLIKGQRS